MTGKVTIKIGYLQQEKVTELANKLGDLGWTVTLDKSVSRKLVHETAMVSYPDKTITSNITALAYICQLLQRLIDLSTDKDVSVVGDYMYFFGCGEDGYYAESGSSMTHKFLQAHRVK